MNRIIAELPIRLPLPTVGCGGARRLGSGAVEIPATVTVQGGRAAVVVTVCIGHRHPLPFVVDTGASRSAIDLSVLRRLRLPAAGPPKRLSGAGCTARAASYAVSSWTAGGLPLRPQALIAVRLAYGHRPAPAGLLGSDVWSRFGALRIDFVHQDLIIAGPQAPAPTRRTLLEHPKPPHVAPALLRGRPRISAVMVVERSPTESFGVALLEFGNSAPQPFIVDTGATLSVIDAPQAKLYGLRSEHVKSRQVTICSVDTVPHAMTGHWSIVTGARHAQTLLTQPLAPQSIGLVALGGPGHPVGLFGADALSRYGSVVIDYADGRLLLGAG